MDQFFARNRLSAYLDGDLSSAEASDVARAIDQDPDLRAEFESLRRAVSLLKSAGPVSAPTGFHARVLEAVRDEPVPGGVVVWFRRHLARVPVEAVALAAAAAIVIIVIQGRETGTDSPLPTAAVMRTADGVADPANVDAPAPAGGPPQPSEPVASKGGASEYASAGASGADVTDAVPPGVGLPAQQAKKVGVGTAVPSPATRRPDDRDAYVPEWEQQAQVGEGSVRDPSGDMSKPFGYAISLAREDTLFQLSALAERLGGQMLDAAGRNLSPTRLTEDRNYMRVQLVVPQSRASEAHNQIRSLGGVSSPPPTSAPLHGGARTGFVIEVQLAP